MSNQYNQAGTSLIVDEIIELGGSTKTNSKLSKQQLKAALLKRDTSLIQATLLEISADSKMTPEEKIILKREWLQLVASNSIIVGMITTMGIEESTVVATYTAAFTALNDYLTPFFVEMDVTSTIDADELNTKFSDVYTSSSVIEEISFTHTTGLLSGYDYREKFEVKIDSTKGVTLPLDETDSVLSVTLLHDGEDVTDDYDPTAFTWVRISSDRVADAAYGEQTGKSISVNISDLVEDSATFMCKYKYYYADSVYYAKSGIITLSKEVPGESVIEVQISSSDGNAFRTGSANTTLTAYVFEGSEDITDTLDASLFNWKRVSTAGTLADEIWNTSSSAIGRKSIIVTPENTIGRTVFSCEVDI